MNSINLRGVHYVAPRFLCGHLIKHIHFKIVQLASDIVEKMKISKQDEVLTHFKTPVRSGQLPLCFCAAYSPNFSITFALHGPQSSRSLTERC